MTSLVKAFPWLLTLTFIIPALPTVVPALGVEVALAAPPAHAPAHGVRRKYDFNYRYYPDLQVYFDTGRKLWFWIDGRRWEAGADLPGSLHLRLGNFVEIGLDSPRPYLFHQKHLKSYPPGQLKKMTNPAHQGGGPPTKIPPGQAKKNK